MSCISYFLTKLDLLILIAITMDAHFDNTIYHPSFLEHENDVTKSFFDFSFGHFMQMAHEYSLPDDVVDSAVHRAWDFMNLQEIPVVHDSLTSLYPNNPHTYSDDVFGINVEQLKDLGIHDENSLSLICTHEAGHRVTQLLLHSGHITTWESELTSDALMGFRAAAEHIDTTVVSKSLQGADCPTHPGGDLREHYLEIGKEIWNELDKDNIKPTMDNFLSRLDEHLKMDRSSIIARESVFHTNSINNSDNFNGYTSSEIEYNKNQAQNKIDHLKSVIRDATTIAGHKASAGEPHNSEDYTIRTAKSELDQAIKDKNKWASEHPH